MMIQSQVCQNLLMTLDMAEYLLDLIDGVMRDGETENFVCIDALMKNLGWQKIKIKLGFIHFKVTFCLEYDGTRENCFVSMKMK